VRGALRHVGAVVASVVLLTGCTSGLDSASDVEREVEVEDLTEVQPAGFERYAALGDSFTAAPLVPDTALAEGCLRSDGNYPSLVADRLDVDTFVDVSCGGAETRHLVEPQWTVEDASVPPQLRAVTPNTDLVTLGIGGNDFGLFSTLVSTCSRLGRQDPTGSPCADHLAEQGTDLVEVAGRISSRVETSVRRVRRRSPEATVMVIGYPRLTPASGRCRALPFAPGDYRHGTRVSEALNESLRRAAESAGAIFVDMYARSEGHDICSDAPWVNGARTVKGEALAFHPFAAGQEAVADAVVELIESQESASD
jgi:lysophospholipase L1-like esterase